MPIKQRWSHHSKREKLKGRRKIKILLEKRQWSKPLQVKTEVEKCKYLEREWSYNNNNKKEKKGEKVRKKKKKEEKEKLKDFSSIFIYQALFWCFGNTVFLSLTRIPRCRCYYSSHFIGKETKSPRGYIRTWCFEYWDLSGLVHKFHSRTYHNTTSSIVSIPQ